MALARVTDSFSDLTEDIIVNISGQGHRDHGMWIDGEIVPNPCVAVVQPMGDNEVNEMNPDGETDLTHLKFYIDIEKYPLDIVNPNDSKNAVTIQYDGQLYKSLRIKNYGKLGGFRTVYSVLLRNETIEPITQD